MLWIHLKEIIKIKELLFTGILFFKHWPSTNDFDSKLVSIYYDFSIELRKEAHWAEFNPPMACISDDKSLAHLDRPS